MPPLKLTFCVAEDREGAEIGIKLLILSLSRHCPEVPVALYRPDPLPSLVTWLASHLQVRLIPERPPGAQSWDCKPHALLPLLSGDDAGQVVWLDSDLLVSRDPRPLFASLSQETLVLTQEPLSQPHQGTALRAAGWGLPIGTSYPNTFNSSVVRVTSSHIRLLKRWRELLASPEYLKAKDMPLDLRPAYIMADQDLLNALIGSAEFSDVPLQMLAHGRDVLHTGGALGFTLGERLSGIFRPPPVFIHAIGSKPWVLLNPGNPPRDAYHRFRRLLQEISEYVAQAKSYRDKMDEPTGWLDNGSVFGRLLRVLGFGHWALRGLPLTLAATLIAAFTPKNKS